MILCITARSKLWPQVSPLQGGGKPREKPYRGCSHTWRAKLLQSCSLLFATQWIRSPPGSSVHGLFQATISRIVECVAMPFSRTSSHPGIEPMSLCPQHWQAGSLPWVPPEKPWRARLSKTAPLPAHTRSLGFSPVFPGRVGAVGGNSFTTGQQYSSTGSWEVRKGGEAKQLKVPTSALTLQLKWLRMVKTLHQPTTSWPRRWEPLHHPLLLWEPLGKSEMRKLVLLMIMRKKGY